MNDTDRRLLLEDALRGYLSRRCKRAYAHEMRNGLQGIYGGVDALTRAARSTKPALVPLERLTQFVQQAISNHERGLDRVLESVAAEEHAPAAIDINAFLSDLLRFLTHDAARHSVRASMQIDQALVTTAAPAKLRLIFLGLLTDAIDSMPDGGNIRISGQTTGARVQIDLLDSRRADATASFVSESIDHLVDQLSGRIARQLTPDAGYLVRVELPALSAQIE